MKVETAVHTGFHSANAAMVQTEYNMAEATIGALANLATATAAYRGVVTALTQANSRLVKQLEETSKELRELKACSTRTGATDGAQELSLQLRPITDGLMATRWARLTQA
jgi:phage shock protein A